MLEYNNLKELIMSTAKEIEEIIGISSRTIDMWSRSRDDRYLLARLLKSYSKFDLMQRIDHILKEDGLIRKSWKEVILDIAKNLYTAGIIDSDEKFYIRESSRINFTDLSTLPNFKELNTIEEHQLYLWTKNDPSLIIEMLEKPLYKGSRPIKRILMIDFISLLPSRNNIVNMYDRHASRIIKILKRNDKDGLEYHYSAELILITKSQKPKFLREDDELAEKIKILDLDEVAKKLYEKEVIVI